MFGPAMMGGMMGHRRRGGQGGRDPFLILLGLRLLDQINRLEHKPPATLALMGAQVAAHLNQPALLGRGGLGALCLHPRVVVEHFTRGELPSALRRVMGSALFHSSDWHL